VPTGNRLPDAGAPLTVTGATPPDVVALYVTATGEPFDDACVMLLGHLTTSVGGATVTELMVSWTLIVAVDPVVLSTRNDVWYVPAANADVRNVNVSVPLLTPLAGDTVSHVAVGAAIFHLRAPLPALLIWIVLEAAFVPTFACTLIDVRLTDRTGSAAAP
jgi:hypothetical protein